jgi:chondroitin AC lyase
MTQKNFGMALTLCVLVATIGLSDDLEVVRSRVLEPLLVAPDHAPIAKLVDSLQPDGHWPDIDYADLSRSAWRVPTHLSRLRSLAQAYRAAPPHARDRQLLAAARKALDYWLAHDPQNPNWWWNQIGVPKSLLPILLLLDEQLSASQRATGLEILRRAKIGMTGQNLVWVAEVTAGRALLQRDRDLAVKAYQRIADEIRISSAEGIQADFSFHQHGPCLYSHGYGAAFIVDTARIAAQVEGTSMQFPAEKIEILARLILDGTQWMARGQATDFGAEGREIARKGQTASHLAAASRYMRRLETGREAEFQALLDRSSNRPAPPLSGNRHFWRSDFMAHHRQNYYASARMHSKRLANTDGPANSEGLLSHHLADGCFVLMQHGKEYEDIFGVWDWQRIPGTTAQQLSQLTGSPRRMGTTTFVGGVSNGTYGVAACDFQRGELAARKSWFFFDHEVVCLGAGISCGSQYPVVTTVNQCALNGKVIVSQDGERHELTPGTHKLQDFDFLWHDRVAYVCLNAASLSISSGARSGSWHDANRRYADRQETRNIFLASIDHGVRPDNAHYAYAVLPAISADGVAEQLARDSIQIVSNTPTKQAVEHRDLGLIAASFYEPGTLAVASSWETTVDQPCLLVIETTGNNVRVTASQPSCNAKQLCVGLRHQSDPSQRHHFVVDLPQGLEAGRSVTVQ